MNTESPTISGDNSFTFVAQASLAWVDLMARACSRNLPVSPSSLPSTPSLVSEGSPSSSCRTRPWQGRPWCRGPACSGVFWPTCVAVNKHSKVVATKGHVVNCDVLEGKVRDNGVYWGKTCMAGSDLMTGHMHLWRVFSRSAHMKTDLSALKPMTRTP